MPTEMESDTKFNWRELPRVELPKRSVVERVSDFNEVYANLDEKTVRQQAARCIQCPNPACTAACPMTNRIPEWLGLTAEGHLIEAARLVISTSSMPEVFCRICAQERQCEANCLLEGPSQAVPIGAIERFLQEIAFRHGLVNPTPAAPNGFKVAVIGSGPAGLICANDLSRLGYAVTVIECHDVPGGLLVQGIPAFKLERAIVERRIALLKQLGVRFALGVRLGADITLSTLRREFDAVFLGIGARQARHLEIPGAQLDGVIQGVTFLMAWNSGLHLGGPPFQVRDLRVAVLGAGDTAMDCLRTALRAGARSATCIYRRDEASMPAMRKHIASALEEGAHFIFGAAPAMLVGSPEGKVRAVRYSKAESVDARRQDPMAARTAAPRDCEMVTDLVLVAFGFERVPCPPGCGLEELSTDPNGNMVVNGHGMTNVAGVFAAGDLVHGPGQLVETVREARRAAQGIHAWLSTQVLPPAG